MKLELIHCHGAKASEHRPLLFVHGSYCGAWIWAEKFLPYFAGQGFACHAVSLRGHGGSEGDVTWASLGDYVDDLEAAIAEIGGQPVLIGHSLGGLVIQHYLARANTVSGAVLLASVPPSGLASSAMHLSMFAPDVLWQLGLLQSLGPDAVSSEVIHRAFFSGANNPQAVAHLLSKLQRESHRVGAELLAPSQPTPPKGSLPILTIGGDADVFLPCSAFRETATYFRGDLQILHGAPHGLMLDTVWWEPTADAIIAWLKSKLL